MSLKISGQRLLGRFGWTCANERLEKKLMLQCDFDELKSCLENNDAPDSILLALCFPKPVRELRSFARSIEQNMWECVVVMAFLQQYQGSGGDCAVKIATVCSINPNGTIQVICGNETFIAINLFDLDLQIGEMVYLHRRVVIEKAE